MDQAMNDTVDLPRSVTKNSRTDSPCTRDNSKKQIIKIILFKNSHKMEGLARLTLFGSMLLLQNKEKKIC